ncbi:DUF2155 domain-containing protein [Loktanella sp. Alg231-35]|uniref:DUF2155 domain-containing protein n=1 Tax=Loktanella sp. Alg231-35 TaxID=1922220 RepID=UPI0027953AFF|nr:DUF2155 domain-containing protein [Loktanella sp. Alg231-35]
MRSSLTFLFLMLAAPLAAQDEIVVTPLEELIGELVTTPNEVTEEFLTTSTEAQAQQVSVAEGGELRVLDKLTGEVKDLSLQNGEMAALGFLAVTLNECRYPVENPSGDAFVRVEVVDRKESTPLFAGWIIATAPALNAMDHPRYDVWALRCITS